MTIDRTKKMEAKINYKKFLKMAKNKINEPEPDHPRLRFFLCFFVALFLLEVIPLRHIIDMHPENKDTLKYSDTMMDEVSGHHNSPCLLIDSSRCAATIATVSVLDGRLPVPDVLEDVRSSGHPQRRLHFVVPLRCQQHAQASCAGGVLPQLGQLHQLG